MLLCNLSSFPLLEGYTLHLNVKLLKASIATEKAELVLRSCGNFLGQ